MNSCMKPKYDGMVIGLPTIYENKDGDLMIDQLCIHDLKPYGCCTNVSLKSLEIK